MRTCSSCRWWSRLVEPNGWCWLITKKKTDKAITYNCCITCESMRVGTFQTTPDFGCTEHEENEVEK
jgi:hypothetical protein